ncbi:MAG: tetratricopeptide repeat protein [Thiovulaceae bacterium]|nr:tetratricopeptide repeat protein [Sulfurimonadaceae bacterium]
MRYAFFLLLLLLPFSLLAGEPSAFGAGNLDSDNPYGLTSAEKKILENKEIVQQNNRTLHSQNNEIESLRERVDGLQSVLEAIAMKSQKNRVALGDLSKSRENEGSSVQERIKLLEAQTVTNSENIVQLKTAIEGLSKIMDDQSSSFVTKENYNKLVNEVNNFKRLVAGELKKKPIKTSSKRVSNGDLATDAMNDYDDKKYGQALEEYKELVNRNYKPAHSHYMIGQIYYYQNNYAKAIAHYKESASLYKKASYMPTLMYRTAVSMEKTGDQKHAKAFYKAVIAKYPDSDEARASQERLVRLK